MQNRQIESREQTVFATALRNMEKCGRFNHLPFFKFTAIPEMGKRTPRQGKRNKDMGYLAGFPDLSFFWISETGKQEFGFIEFKARYKDLLGGNYKGELSPSQKLFKADCEAHGIRYEVAYTAEEAFEVLRKWGVKKL